VVNAYALSFGGLLLLGGRAGDLLGRRRVFVAGLAVFSAASLAGGFATSQAWLLAARAVQGIGGAMIAPTAPALIATTFGFPSGRRGRFAGAAAYRSAHSRSVNRAASAGSCDQAASPVPAQSRPNIEFGSRSQPETILPS
jgi:MFS family permease